MQDLSALSLQANPLLGLQRNGVPFVKDQADIRIDLQLADASLHESAIQRARTVELEPALTSLFTLIAIYAGDSEFDIF